MAVCNDKACETILCGDCKDLIPSMCGDRVPSIVEGSCSAIRFEGVGDVSINQGECIDLTEGVHAYDGNGNEIEYTVTPSEIPCCGVGEYEVKYSAVGIGNKMLPSFCTNAFMLMLSDCGMDTKSVLRKIIVNAIVSPIISGIDTACIDKDTLFNPMSGVSAVDGNGNTLEVDHNGIYDQVASGSIASFESVGGNIKSLIASIEPVQSGSGTPSPDNIRPISGHTEVVVTRTGKNLLDKANRIYTASNLWYGADTANGTPNGSLVLKSGTYTFSTSEAVTGLYVADRSGNIATKYNNNFISFTLSEEKPIKLMTYKSGSTIDVIRAIDTQLELGSTATDYEPYEGQTYTTDLGRTVYGGTLDVVSGELVVDRAMVTLRSRGTWSKSSSYAGGFFMNTADVRDEYGVLFKRFTPFACSHAETVTSVNDYVYGTCFCDSSINIRIMSADSTLQNWKDYLEAQYSANTPVQICGELATPQTYQLTAQQVTALLGDNNVWADTGDVDVEYPIEMPDGAFTFPTDGAYEITYHAEDECGNETTETRLIVVGSENSVCKARVCCASTEEC